MLNQKRKEIKSMTGLKSKIKRYAFCSALAFAGCFGSLYAQRAASPANWLYPQGNSEGVLRVKAVSGKQALDSISIKWSTPYISGDVRPLIGNIVDNEKMFPDFPYAPNEITAVVGDRLVILDGKGRLLTNRQISDIFPEKDINSGIINVSSLMDTSGTGEGPFVLGLETIESRRSDSLAVAYIAGFDNISSKAKILRRLSINLRNQAFYPNVSASLKPVYGRSDANGFFAYGIVNMAQPEIGDPFFVEAPYFRGLAEFQAFNTIFDFPLPDIGDEILSRVTIGAEASFSQPSVTIDPDGRSVMLLPNYPTPSIDQIIPNDITAGGTNANKSYLLSFDISNPGVIENFPLADLSVLTKGTRPRIRPFYVNINDNATGDSLFIIAAEEYNGRDGSDGYSALHLFDLNGNQLTSSEKIDEPPYLPPSYAGGKNNYWSVAVGEADGNTINEWLPYFPNNRGNEIIVTNSSREFAVAGSRLSVLRYNSGPEVAKPSPPGEILFPFDTIATQRISGWVACVNDFDGDPSGKDEIFLADGARLLVLRMKDYRDISFRSGKAFDTLFAKTFTGQTISNVAVSDLDGDGLNDLIVTTFDSTYVLGTALTKTLNMREPKIDAGSKLDYCVNDTIHFRWDNLVSSTGDVNLYFVELPLQKITTIKENISNEGEYVTYDYPADSLVLGKTGFFIAAVANNPTKNYDTTSVVNIGKPILTVDPSTTAEFPIGKSFTVSGLASCADSVAFEYSIDGITWERIASEEIASDMTFNLQAQLPCMELFSCDGNSRDSVILGRTLGIIGNYTDSSNTFLMKVMPSVFPLQIDTCTSACPTRELHWSAEEIQFACDTVNISVSFDNGTTYSMIDAVPASIGAYTWNVPETVPDSVLIRVCCEYSCVRIDTLISNTKVKYIKIVAPNPFRYPEILEVVYSVNKDQNVSVKIYDQANKLVKSIINSEMRNQGTAYCDRWDGTRSDGSFAANGMYYLILELEDGAREIYPIFIRK